MTTPSAQSLLAYLRADVTHALEIPLYAIPDDAPFTLDQHLAFGRVMDALPKLLAVVEAAREVIVLEYSSAATDQGNDDLIRRAWRLREALEALDG